MLPMPKSSIYLACTILWLCVVVTQGATAQRRAAGAPPAGMMRIAIDVGAVGFGSDYTKTKDNYRFRIFGELDLDYLMSPVFMLGIFAQTGTMAARYQSIDVSNSFFAAGIEPELRWPVARGAAVPYVALRLGGIFFKPRSSTETYENIGEDGSGLMYGGGIGFEYIIRRKFAIRLEIGANLTSSDELDNLISGPQNDGYSYVSLGVGYYFSLGRTGR